MTEKTEASDTNPPTEKSERLFTSGFISLLGVSFLGAANDNIVKQILVLMVVVPGLWQNYLGEGTQGIISMVLTVPFIFLSGFAGQIADKFSKSLVIFWVKVAEIPIALFAMTALWMDNFWMSLFSLFLLAVQSSFFQPAKFGVIPDVVDEHRLSGANGVINATVNVAVILGSVLAGPLTDMYYPTKNVEPSAVTNTENSTTDSESDSQSNESDDSSEQQVLRVFDESQSRSWLPAGLTLLAFSLLGLGAVSMMPKMEPVDPNAKLLGDFIIAPHVQTFKDSNRALMVVLFSWSGFYMIGQLALLMLPDFKSVLGVSATVITNLIGLLAVSIVVGSVMVGYISGKSIKPHYALVGAIGMSVSFTIMGLAPMSLVLLSILTFMTGLFAGFYIVPLQSLLQFLSPSNERGRFFGTANALSFAFVSGAGALYYGLASAGMPVNRIPLVCAGLAIIGTIVGAIELNRIMKAQENVEAHSDESETSKSSE